jgi:hypothetical protein
LDLSLQFSTVPSIFLTFRICLSFPIPTPISSVRMRVLMGLHGGLEPWPSDRDEVKRREGWGCEGCVCDLEARVGNLLLSDQRIYRHLINGLGFLFVCLLWSS